MLNNPPTLIGFPINDKSRMTFVSDDPKLDPSMTRHIKTLINQDIAKKLTNFVVMFLIPSYYRLNQLGYLPE